MESVNLPYYYEIGSALGRLVAIPQVAPTNAPPDEKFGPWNLGNTVYSMMLPLYQAPWNLKASQVFGDFAALLSIYGESVGFPVPGKQASTVSEAIARQNFLQKAVEFQVILEADLQRLPIYFVPRQGIYETDLLIAQAEHVLPEETRDKLPGPVFTELRQAGQCLAFGVPTACGFHMMRAVELVLYHYSETVDIEGKKKPGKSKNWGDYTAYLKDSKEPDVAEILALLQPLKKNVRDVIAHPEKVLTAAEAYNLFQEGQTAINRMAERL